MESNTMIVTAAEHIAHAVVTIEKITGKAVDCLRCNDDSGQPVFFVSFSKNTNIAGVCQSAPQQGESTTADDLQQGESATPDDPQSEFKTPREALHHAARMLQTTADVLYGISIALPELELNPFRDNITETVEGVIPWLTSRG